MKTKWIRVRDLLTGHEYSISHRAVKPLRHMSVDEPAADVNGNPLPPKYRGSESAASEYQPLRIDEE